MNIKGPARVFVWGFGGVLLAALLSLGAFALAGRSIGEPVQPQIPPIVISSTRAPSPTATPSRDDDDKPTPSPTRSASAGDEPDGGGGGDGGGDDRDDDDDDRDDDDGYDDD